MNKRSLSTIALIGILIPIFFLKTIGITLLIISTTIGILIEITLLKKTNYFHQFIIITTYITLTTLCLYLVIKNQFPEHFFHICIALIITLILSELLYKKLYAFNTSLFYIKSIMLLTLCTVSTLLLYKTNVVLFFNILATISLTDILSYLLGKRFGKTKLSPISPNKTIEGFLYAYLFLAISIILLYTLHIHTVKESICLLIVPMFALFGDLHESLLKRTLNVKDSSHIIPGHGGLYDRLDSYIIALPICYLFLTW